VALAVIEETTHVTIIEEAILIELLLPDIDIILNIIKIVRMMLESIQICNRLVFNPSIILILSEYEKNLFLYGQKSRGVW
jgi:hypothetical protein